MAEGIPGGSSSEMANHPQDTSSYVLRGVVHINDIHLSSVGSVKAAYVITITMYWR